MPAQPRKKKTTNSLQNWPLIQLKVSGSVTKCDKPTPIAEGSSWSSGVSVSRLVAALLMISWRTRVCCSCLSNTNSFLLTLGWEYQPFCQIPRISGVPIGCPTQLCLRSEHKASWKTYSMYLGNYCLLAGEAFTKSMIVGISLLQSHTNIRHALQEQYILKTYFNNLFHNLLIWDWYVPIYILHTNTYEINY